MATASTKDIKRRQKSIENTLKITKAMELVAFSKLKKGRQRVRQTAPFFNELYSIIKDISKNQQVDSVFFKQQPVKKRCYIVIAGDKGLAGSYNGNVLRFAESEMGQHNCEDVDVVTIGRRASDFFKRQRFNLVAQYDDVIENFSMDLSIKITEKIVNDFCADCYQEVSIIFTDFVSVLVQKPVLQKILPLTQELGCQTKKSKNILYEPSESVVFNMIMPKYVAGILYGAVIESFASEQGARRLAMEAANKNAKDMLKDLNIIFNKVRQSNITQEITEIATGAQAI